MKQKHENKEVFKFSSKGKKHPISVLRENLLKLIHAAYHGPDTEPQRIRTTLLVGKGVKHRFSDGNYVGRVISVVPGFVNFYNIVYDNDVSEDGITKCVYTYKLLDDYKKGDLEIIPEVSVECLAFRLFFCCFGKDFYRCEVLISWNTNILFFYLKHFVSNLGTIEN